jgi:hypothetical protein
MKILCSYSGIEFTTEFFPGTFSSRELHHPVFSLEQKRLLSYTGKWAAGELTSTDSYLLFLALLHSSEQIHFRVPVKRTPMTDSIVANNMEYLVRTVIKLNAIRTPGTVFPYFAISSDTSNLANIKHWIEVWENCWKDFESGSRRDIIHRDLAKRESALQRMIKNPHKPIKEYASQLADWAAVAGSFPTFLVPNIFTKEAKQIPLSAFWKEIIIRSTRNEYLYTIPDNDLKELLEHCEENISAGSIYSHALFEALRNATKKKHNFLGLGDIDLRSTYAMLDDPKDVESANLRALIDSAPLEEPRIEQYPTKFAYMKAKLRWDMSKKFGNASSNSNPTE